MSFPRTKASTTARGYGAAHQRARRAVEAQLAQAGSLPCTRCPRPVLVGQAWHLDHNDQRTGYLGVAHASCNRNAGSSKGARVANLNKKRARATQVRL